MARISSVGEPSGWRRMRLGRAERPGFPPRLPEMRTKDGALSASWQTIRRRFGSMSARRIAAKMSVKNSGLCTRQNSPPLASRYEAAPENCAGESAPPRAAALDGSGDFGPL